MKQKRLTGGWATAELILVMPIVVMIISVILFAGGYYSAKLQLLNAAHAAAIKAGLKNPADCSGARATLTSLLPDANITNCRWDETLVYLDTRYVYKPVLPYLDSFSRDISVTQVSAIIQNVN